MTSLVDHSMGTIEPSDERERRAFLRAAGLFGMGALVPGVSYAQNAASVGTVLAAGDGERLVHFRDGGEIVIALSAATGSPDLAMGTQQVKVGTGIPMHRHLAMTEAFVVLEGSGTVVLGDARHPFEKGATISIPRNTWHSFENAERELRLLWMMTPAGLDGFFRATCSPPGAPPKGLTRDQIREIARQHGTEFR